MKVGWFGCTRLRLALVQTGWDIVNWLQLSLLQLFISISCCLIWKWCCQCLVHPLIYLCHNFNWVVHRNFTAKYCYICIFNPRNLNLLNSLLYLFLVEVQRYIYPFSLKDESEEIWAGVWRGGQVITSWSWHDMTSSEKWKQLQQVTSEQLVSSARWAHNR